ncbi:MAG: AmmeMemoRadiSam system protein B, partial [Chloroflexi bacterium]|nr:AmmeMemoRadiSam system protein B [Chloroflexota bacterium]
MKAKSDIRPSAIAGRWYPGNARQLRVDIDRYLKSADFPEIIGEVIALVVPHAGYRYSGAVAGHAFAALQSISPPDLVAVVSPMHGLHQAPLLTSAHEAYSTPLGEIPIDSTALQTLNEHLKDMLGYGLTAIRFDDEHALEIELPFLQQALSAPFALLPVMVRDQSVQTMRKLGIALAKTLDGCNALVVASTDLSHFYPQEKAKKLDAEILKHIEALNPEAIIQSEERKEGFACGRGAVAAMLWAAQKMGANHAKIVKYATSGEVSGDYSQVVG